MKFFIAVLLLILAGCAQNTADNTRGEVRRAAVTAERKDEAERYVDVTVSQASTPLLDDSASRVENINIACGAINGLALYPGGSFSFNESVGRRTEEKGYRDAPVLVDGHKEQGCGGGVCQVSSTVYMAALDAGLSIDERHAHSDGVAYAPEGRDATVVFGEKDLVFTNNTDEVLTLHAWTDGENVFSSITKKALDKSE